MRTEEGGGIGRDQPTSAGTDRQGHRGGDSREGTDRIACGKEQGNQGGVNRRRDRVSEMLNDLQPEPIGTGFGKRFSAGAENHPISLHLQAIAPNLKTILRSINRFDPHGMTQFDSRPFD